MLRFYKKKKGYARYVMFYSNLIVFALSAGYLFRYYYNNYQNKSKINQLNEIADSDSEPVIDEEGNVIDRYGGKVRETYPELVGRLTYHYYSKEMQLPVMQHKDNDYWLHKDVETNDSDAGTPFADYRCDLKDSMIVVIYAHNMRDLSQFGALKLYNEKSYWKEYKTITYESMYEDPCEYEVVAAFYSQIYDKDSPEFKYYNYFSLNSKEEYDSYVSNVKKLSCYDTGVTPEYGDKLLLLSTCDYTQGLDNGRFAVLFRKTGTSVKNSEFEIDEPEKKDDNAATEKPDDKTNNSTQDKTNNNNTNNNSNSNSSNNTAATPKPTKTPATKAPVPTKTPTVATKTPTATKTPKPATKEPVVTKAPTPEPDPVEPEPDPGEETEETE